MMAADGELPLVRRNGKSEAAFRTISEVADELEVPQHVLRFWESKFPQVKPLKRGGGRRYYRPEDVTLLKRIRDLLYSEGYTIKGVQKLLREGGNKDAAPGGEPVSVPSDELVSDGKSKLPGEEFAVAPNLGRDEDDFPPMDDCEGDDGDGDDVLVLPKPSDVKPLASNVRHELTDILVELEHLRSLLNPR